MNHYYDYHDGSDHYYNDTWEWDGSNWTQVIPLVSPSARRYHAMAFDNSRGKVVMFGGYTSSGRNNETWEWDGTDWSQIKGTASATCTDACVCTATTCPSARSSHAMTFDSAHGKMVLFGGYVGSYNNETWEWDGNNWTKKNPIAKPSVRAFHAMTYDSVHGEVILFGGSSGSINDETWIWNGENWTRMNSAAKPSARTEHAMADDSVRGKVVLFGGYDSSYSSETWEWDGTNWIKMNPLTKPTARRSHAMAYDSTRGKVVLFGGYNGSPNDETWEWDGSVWEEMPPTTEPDPFNKAVAFDEKRGRAVMFGGYTSNPVTYYDTTWEWGDTQWRAVNPVSKPLARNGHAMVYDPEREQVVLFGGFAGTYSDETWVWDGVDWVELHPPHNPPARSGHAMVYDTVRDRIVLFGGVEGSEEKNDLWVWNGADWEELFPAERPAPRMHHAMAFNRVQGKTVLFGGVGGSSHTTRYNDTWEWDGSAWEKITATNEPPARSNHALFYDVARNRTILFGGYDSGDQYMYDTWEFDGSEWKEIQPEHRPAARSGHGMVYDTVKARGWLFGGSGKSADGSFYYVADEWEWNGGGNERPGQIMNIAYESSGITDESQIRSLSVLFNTGGLGDITGTPTSGVDLLTWKHDRWVKVSSNTADPNNLAPVTWETTDPIEIQMLLNSGLRKFNFAVVPAAPNGFLTDMGKISTDYAEVVVRYTIP